jgi:uncharacterized protein with PQ loop repeat
MDVVWWIGFIASIFITLSMLPQLHKMWQKRYEEFDELHKLWFIFGIIGSILFLIYGFMIDQIGLIILNGVGLVSLMLMYMIYIGVWRKWSMKR